MDLTRNVMIIPVGKSPDDRANATDTWKTIALERGIYMLVSEDHPLAVAAAAGIGEFELFHPETMTETAKKFKQRRTAKSAQ